MPNEFKVKRGLIVETTGSISGSNVVVVDGVTGRLFTVVDTFSGSLFSVNTVSGLPIIEAFSDNTVRMGQYGQRVLYISQSRVGFGKETGLNALVDVSGSAVITGSLGVVSGSFTVTTGSGIEFQVIETGVKIGNTITDRHPVTGSISVSGSLNYLQTFNTRTGSYTLALTDAGVIVEMNSGSANTVTVPNSSSVNFPLGSFVDVIQYGAGQTSFVTASGVTVRSTNGWLKINAQYGAATLLKRGGNEWYLVGNLNA